MPSSPHKQIHGPSIHLHKVTYKLCSCNGKPTRHDNCILNSRLLSVFVFVVNVQAMELYQEDLVQIVVAVNVLQAVLILEILSKTSLEISLKQTAIGGNVVLNSLHRMTLSR